MLSMSYVNEILHIYVYWKIILFQQLGVTPILVNHETSCTGNLIYLAFHAYEEHQNWRSYESCRSI
jgi:hypothetical protein